MRRDVPADFNQFGCDSYCWRPVITFTLLPAVAGGDIEEWQSKTRSGDAVFYYTEDHRLQGSATVRVDSAHSDTWLGR